MSNQDEYFFADIGGNNLITKTKAFVSELRISVVLIPLSFECFFNTELQKFVLDNFRLKRTIAEIRQKVLGDPSLSFL